MAQFELTIDELKRIVRIADSDEDMEDILEFEVKNGRLIITQHDWGRFDSKQIMNKFC